MPREHPLPISVAPADEPEAVVLDLADPERPGRHGKAVGRQAGLDEAGRVTDGTRVVPVHGEVNSVANALNANPGSGRSAVS
jgi:hypothetical protein